MIRVARHVIRGVVLTPDADGRCRSEEDGWVWIGGDGRIDAVGRSADGLPDDVPVVHAGGTLILPAFVDTHVHLPQIDVRARYGAGLVPWLERWIFPAEAAFADPDHAAAIAERFFAELATAGIGTASVFATVHAAATERAFEAAEVSGLRIILGRVMMDRGVPDALLDDVETAIRESLALAEQWEGAGGGRLHYALTPRFAPTSTRELLAATGDAAERAGLRVQTHLAEQPAEITRVAELFPEAEDYLAVYEAAGLVRPGAVFAHAVHCSDQAFRRIADGGAAIACCPTSNAFLGSGLFPLARARDTGVTIGIGSDVGAGPRFSPLDVLRHLAYLGRPDPAELLYRGTLAGAEALDLETETGRLAAGFSADITLLRPPPDASGDPLDRFVQSVFREPEAEIVATIVGGNVVHGRLPSPVDEPCG